MADHHIAQGEIHIARQEELLTRFREQGLVTDEAEKLLVVLNASQVEHHMHRAAISAALDLRDRGTRSRK